MKNSVLVIGPAGALLLSACAMQEGSDGLATPSSRTEMAATTMLVAPDGSARGEALVRETADGLHVHVKGVGLTPGAHAVHIHTTGACTPPGFASAGGHWNPTNRQHGKDNPAGKHMGDMPNMIAGADGGGELEYVIPGARITDGSTPLLDSDGAAVVIHAQADDNMTDPAGNAGGRIACGVLSAPN